MGSTDALATDTVKSIAPLADRLAGLPIPSAKELMGDHTGFADRMAQLGATRQDAGLFGRLTQFWMTVAQTIEKGRDGSAVMPAPQQEQLYAAFRSILFGDKHHKMPEKGSFVREVVYGVVEAFGKPAESFRTSVTLTKGYDLEVREDGEPLIGMTLRGSEIDVNVGPDGTFGTFSVQPGDRLLEAALRDSLLTSEVAPVFVGSSESADAASD